MFPILKQFIPVINYIGQLLLYNRKLQNLCNIDTVLKNLLSHGFSVVR